MTGMSQMDSVDTYGPGLIRSILQHKWGVALAALVVGVLGWFVSTLIPPMYTSTGTIVLSNADAFGEAAADPARKVQQEANRLTSRTVLTAAADELGNGMTEPTLRDRVQLQADSEIGLLEVTATAGDADEAAQIANTVISSYESVSRQATVDQVTSAQEVLQTQGSALQRQIDKLTDQAGGQPDPVTQQRIDVLQTQLVTLQARISEMEANAALFGTGIEDVEKAIPASAPTSPQPMRNAVIAGVVGFAISAALAYWRAGVVDSSRLDPSRIVGAPLLAQIPEFGRQTAESDSTFDQEATEAYQFLLASFEYALAQSGARSVLVTSASPGDGKSLTSLHLARALAVQGRRVMLVDSDIRARGLTMLLGAGEQPGLVELAQGGNLDSVIRRYRISEDVKLPVIPAGHTPHNPTGLLATDRYREAIAKITTASELTIIDSGPLLTVADAASVASHVSGLLLVITARTTRSDLLKVQERLRLVSAPLLGYVLNRVPDAGKLVYPYGLSEPPSPRILRRLTRDRQSRGPQNAIVRVARRPRNIEA